jgi:hypothetical protein
MNNPKVTVLQRFVDLNLYASFILILICLVSFLLSIPSVVDPLFFSIVVFIFFVKNILFEFIYIFWVNNHYFRMAWIFMFLTLFAFSCAILYLATSFPPIIYFLPSLTSAIIIFLLAISSIFLISHMIFNFRIKFRKPEDWEKC